MLRALLVDGDAADPALQRLYPKAFTDDEEASAEFDDITHDELLEQRLAAIDTMERTLRSKPRHRGRAARMARRAERRPPGARCPARGDPRRRRSRTSPAIPETERAYDLYRYLSYLEEHVVEALSS
jgi:hypothetical protein